MKHPIKQLIWGCGIGLALSCTPSFASIAVANKVSPTSQPIELNSTQSNKTATHPAHTSKKHSRAATAFPQRVEATGVSVFIFDPRITSWAVYDPNGNLLRTGHGSGGRNYCADIGRRCHTPSGVFQVYARGGAGCKSKKFPVGRGGAPMPYCSYFHGGYAVHGSYEVRSYNASHGCIRIYPADAKWLQTVLPVGSTVIIKHY